MLTSLKKGLNYVVVREEEKKDDREKLVLEESKAEIVDFEVNVPKPPPKPPGDEGEAAIVVAEQNKSAKKQRVKPVPA